MSRWKILAMTCGLMLGGLAILPTPSQADEWNKKTFLTVNEPLVIPGKVLQPGQYVMRLADSESNRHIVQVFNGDETQVEATILAIPNYRVQPKGGTEFSFWELPQNEPRALRAWFYPGDNFGQEFAYPKEMAEKLAQNNQQTVPTVAENGQIGETAPSGNASAQATSPCVSESSNASAQSTQSSANQPCPCGAASTSTSAAATPCGSSATMSQPSTTEQSQADQSAMNQNTQPSTTEENQTATAPSAADQNANQPPAVEPGSNASANAAAPEQLPRTASPFPLLGLAGLLSFGAAGIARLAHKLI